MVQVVPLEEADKNGPFYVSARLCRKLGQKSLWKLVHYRPELLLAFDENSCF